MLTGVHPKPFVFFLNQILFVISVLDLILFVQFSNVLCLHLGHLLKNRISLMKNPTSKNISQNHNILDAGRTPQLEHFTKYTKVLRQAKDTERASTATIVWPTSADDAATTRVRTIVLAISRYLVFAVISPSFFRN